MKERPIIFSGPMVRAIIEGRKTQTRRVVKPQPTEIDGQLRTQSAILLAAIFGMEATKSDEKAFAPKCHYGVPGDRLWCKETWQDGNGGIYYKADGNHPGPWKSPLHMPRWASRITLEIESVRVERLQEISEEDAIAEGFGGPGYGRLAVLEMSRVWDEINGKGAWGENPWVRVLSFKKV